LNFFPTRYATNLLIGSILPLKNKSLLVFLCFGTLFAERQSNKQKASANTTKDPWGKLHMLSTAGAFFI
jgi:hypothetical protein